MWQLQQKVAEDVIQLLTHNMLNYGKYIFIPLYLQMKAIQICVVKNNTEQNTSIDPGNSLVLVRCVPEPTMTQLTDPYLHHLCRLLLTWFNFNLSMDK